MGALHDANLLQPGQGSLAHSTDTLPSSPSQTYLNLLVLEANLRCQYLNLRARRRKNAFVLTVLTAWIAYFVYAQWLRPREDGTGVGGSVYWLVDATEKVALIGGVVMSFLFWVTGQWERGVRWPRRWLTVTNRGLRVFNCKLVVVPRSWWRELLSSFYFIIPFAFFMSPGMNYQPVDGRLLHSVTQGQQLPRRGSTSVSGVRARRSSVSIGQRPSSSSGNQVIEEDLAPGGDYVKIVLLPKPFTPDFREKWEIFRAGFWEKENEHRDQLRKAVAAHLREPVRQPRQARGWFGWFRRSRAPSTAPNRKMGARLGGDPGPRPSSASSAHSRQSSIRNNIAKQAPVRRRRKNSTASANSSVNGIIPPATPTVIPAEDDHHGARSYGSGGYLQSGGQSLPVAPGSLRAPATEGRQRRWSNSTTGSVGSAGLSITSMQSRRRRPTTPLVEVQSANSTVNTRAQTPITTGSDVSSCESKGHDEQPAASKGSDRLHLRAGPTAGLVDDDLSSAKVVYRRTSLLSVASSAVVTDVSSASADDDVNQRTQNYA